MRSAARRYATGTDRERLRRNVRSPSRAGAAATRDRTVSAENLDFLEEIMASLFRFACTSLVVAIASPAAAQTQQAHVPTPADGYAIHVVAPHLHQGQETGPVHHFCKPISPQPVIVCLLYDSMEPNAPLHGVEYIVAKSMTRKGVPLGIWNSNFHDHAIEIASGRVKVLDMPAEDAGKVAELVMTTDGIIFHLWPMGDAFPMGTVQIDQAVGHRALSMEEFARPLPRKSGSQ
jgi:hypothetical protein